MRDNNTYNNEVILDVAWSCPFGCSGSISNIGSIIPPGRVFLVYVKNAAGEWVICAPFSLFGWDYYNSIYSISGNTMELFSYDVSDIVPIVPVKFLY